MFFRHFAASSITLFSINGGTLSQIAQSHDDLRDKEKYHFDATPFRKFLVHVLTLIFRLFMDLKVEGLENFPKEGAVIVAANHVSNFDVFPMQISLPRPIFYMAKSNLFKNPIVAVLMRNVGAFPVERGIKDLWALDHAEKVLDHALVLGMFPEGTRSRGKGLGLAKTGAARLAIKKQVPIIPMAIIGSDRFFSKFPKRNRVKVKLCKPIPPEKGENVLALTDRVMYSLAENLPPAMRGVYADLAEGFDV